MNLLKRSRSLIKRITSFTTLMRKARAFGQAKLKGNKEEIEKAYKELIQYEELCKNSDEMMVDLPYEEL